ncbi:HET-domain-containing protein [Byssothecium circinans]|uniref:HET-domain-containing protein n=1 Tax=Byssothecium circinans TaxID=147558 RepID=A0A6A5U297_9PLEO|nr:HET-domain-containing protein [Byssothecium circinans]
MAAAKYYYVALKDTQDDSKAAAHCNATWMRTFDVTYSRSVVDTAEPWSFQSLVYASILTSVDSKPSAAVSCGFTLPLPISAGLSGSELERKAGIECHYEPLNYELGQEIRLLILKPGNDSEYLECEIVHANLLDKPKYEALSYTWATESGDDAPSSHIICSKSKCVIHITANCEAALRRLRRQTARRTIWIDSICIDQSNIKERNHQVRQMGTIYASAEQVIVYLGEECRASRAVFKYLAKTIVIRRDESVDIAFPVRESIPSPELVKAFFSRRWFHRVWVLQEVGLARQATVLCGAKSLDWSLFSVDRLKQGGLSTQAVGGTTPGVLLLETDLYKQKPDIVDLLHAGRNALSGDPRDKVFALLSLEKEESKMEIFPDYSKPVEWIFTNVAVQSIKNGRSLDILSHVRGKTGFCHLPSWVPDWTVSTNQKPLRNQFSMSELAVMEAWDFSVSESSIQDKSQQHAWKAEFPVPHLSVWTTKPKFQTVSNRAFDFQFLRECHPVADVSYQLYRRENFSNMALRPLPIRIVVRGHRLAVVESLLVEGAHECSFCPLPHRETPTLISSSMLCSKEIEFWGRVFGGMPNITSKGQRGNLINVGFPPAFASWATCLSCGPSKNKCDIVEGDLAHWGLEAVGDIADLVREGDIAHRGLPESVVYHDVEDYYGRLRPEFHYCREELDAFLEQQRLFGSGRVLFSTGNSLGLGPPCLREGDSVWLLDSSKVAIILRKVDSHYIVIGECHLHGALRQSHPCPKCGKGIQLANAITTETIQIW